MADVQASQGPTRDRFELSQILRNGIELNTRNDAQLVLVEERESPGSTSWTKGLLQVRRYLRLYSQGKNMIENLDISQFVETPTDGRGPPAYRLRGYRNESRIELSYHILRLDSPSSGPPNQHHWSTLDLRFARPSDYHRAVQALERYRLHCIEDRRPSSQASSLRGLTSPNTSFPHPGISLLSSQPSGSFARPPTNRPASVVGHPRPSSRLARVSAYPQTAVALQRPSSSMVGKSYYQGTGHIRPRSAQPLPPNTHIGPFQRQEQPARRSLAHPGTTSLSQHAVVGDNREYERPDVPRFLSQPESTTASLTSPQEFLEELRMAREDQRTAGYSQTSFLESQNDVALRKAEVASGLRPSDGTRTPLPDVVWRGTGSTKTQWPSQKPEEDGPILRTPRDATVGQPQNVAGGQTAIGHCTDQSMAAPPQDQDAMVPDDLPKVLHQSTMDEIQAMNESWVASSAAPSCQPGMEAILAGFLAGSVAGGALHRELATLRDELLDECCGAAAGMDLGGGDQRDLYARYGLEFADRLLMRSTEVVRNFSRGVESAGRP